MKIRYPVVVFAVDPVAPDESRRVVVEQHDGEQFAFKSMAAAEEFMSMHDLVPVPLDEMVAMRAALAGDDDGNDE